MGDLRIRYAVFDLECCELIFYKRVAGIVYQDHLTIVDPSRNKRTVYYMELIDALFEAYCCRNRENSDSIDSEGWTDMISSDERYAIRATVAIRQCIALHTRSSARLC